MQRNDRRKGTSVRVVPADLARSALDDAPDAIVIVDDSGVVRFANRQVSALFGYGHDEILGQRIELLIPERFRSRHVEQRRGYIDKRRVRPMGQGLGLIARRRDGCEFPVEISLSPIEYQGGILVGAAIRDITDRKRVETELLLAREAADIARELANQANRAKSRLLAMASHDLRQPLQTIELLNGSMRRIATGHDLVASLSDQKQAIGAMSRLLTALLDISRTESGAIIPERTDFKLAATFEELRVEFASIAAGKGLRFEIEICDDVAHSDPSLVLQILRNLVSNAVKYTHEGFVRLRCLHEAGFVRVEVLDSGVGIPADQMPRIYDEFYQIGCVPESSRDGYGLGLSIVQRLVNLLSLKLDARSEIGRGSEFSLLLPVGRGHQIMTDRARTTRTSGPRESGARVLLVEDDTSVRNALRRLLTLEGYCVTAVPSLSAAMQHVQDGHGVDLLICDYHLGGGETGGTVVAKLRKMLAGPVPALVMTGDTSSAMKDLSDEPYVRITGKGIDSEELLRLVRTVLANATSQRCMSGDDAQG